MHPSSGIHVPRSEPTSIPGRFTWAARRTLGVLLCAAALFAAGCGNNNLDSGYGITWVTVTDAPSNFTTYTVDIDSITFTRNDGAQVTSLATPETVDFTKLNNLSELWGTGTIATGTYVSASIVLDYTNAVIGVMVNGLPQKANVVDSSGEQVTQVTVNVVMDPDSQLNLLPTYATTAAQRVALDFNLAASTVSVNTATNPVTVTVKPYLTAAIAPPDNKMIRVRGPLINSSVNLSTFTEYVRPFYDQVNNLGSITMFADANTIYTTNGVVSTGATGLDQLSQSSAGTTIAASYTTYEPTSTPSATAGDFHVKYVIAGSTLEDIYTSGIEGDVVARNGNTLTLRGATVEFYIEGETQTTGYSVADAKVLLGPSTLVTADGTATAAGLDYNSIAVGQHIIARGICTACTFNGAALSGPITVDATGASYANTGSVRLIPTNLWGSLVSSASGSLVLDVSTISNWPASDFTFAGNGSTAPTAAAFAVNTGALAIPDTTVGDPLWITGLVAPFGSAPPAFNATAVNSELSIQMAGQTAATAAAAPNFTKYPFNPTPFSCAQANLDCVPASIQASWTGGTTTPFATLTATGATLDLKNAKLASAVIWIGPESIDMKTLAANPQIVPTVPAPPQTVTNSQPGSVPVLLPPVFLPEYSYGDPTEVATSAGLGGIYQFSAFEKFMTGLNAAIGTKPALQLEARGTYNRKTNTFNAISVNVVL